MDLRQRYAVRGLLLSPTNELLLIETRTRTGTMWLTPGGGVELNEKPYDTLKRELREELGYTLSNPGIEVWRRQFRFTSTTSGHLTQQNERYFLVRTEPFTPTFEYVPDPSEQEAMLQSRWWTAAEIEDAPHLRFAPHNLAEVFRQLLEQVPELPLLLPQPSLSSEKPTCIADT